jgi:hypothetical protein
MKKVNAIVVSRPTKIRGKLVEPGKVIDLPSEKTEKDLRDELLSLVGMGKALPATEENTARVKEAVKASEAARAGEGGKGGGSGKKADKALSDIEKRLAALEGRSEALDKKEAELAAREKALGQK